MPETYDLMKTLPLLIATGGLAVRLAGAAVVHFDDAAPGTLPTPWKSARTGQGEPAWTIVKEESAPSQPNALKQSGRADFCLCLNEATRLRDGFVETKFKALSGEKDRAGGVVWRAQDADHYYVCRANALEDNVVLYKMQAGKRQALNVLGREGGYGVKVKVAPNQWHTLRVEFAGSRFKVLFNDRLLFEVEDATFPQAGRTGVWTKADSVTLFDDFASGPLSGS